MVSGDLAEVVSSPLLLFRVSYPTDDDRINGQRPLPEIHIMKSGLADCPGWSTIFSLASSCHLCIFELREGRSTASTGDVLAFPTVGSGLRGLFMAAEPTKTGLSV